MAKYLTSNRQQTVELNEKKTNYNHHKYHEQIFNRNTDSVMGFYFIVYKLIDNRIIQKNQLITIRFILGFDQLL